MRELDRVYLPRVSPTPKVRDGPHTSLVAASNVTLLQKGGLKLRCCSEDLGNTDLIRDSGLGRRQDETVFSGIIFTAGMWCREQKNAAGFRKSWVGQCQ